MLEIQRQGPYNSALTLPTLGDAKEFTIGKYPYRNPTPYGSGALCSQALHE